MRGGYVNTIEDLRSGHFKNSYGVEGMLITGSPDQKRIIDVSEEMKEHVFENVKTAYYKYNGMSGDNQAEEEAYHGRLNEYYKTLDRNDRVAACRTLGRLEQKLASAVSDSIKEKLPGWSAGQQIPKDILDEIFADEKITSIVTGDIREASAIFGGASFHVITCNPPYMVHHHGLENAREEIAVARHEILCSLQDVLSQAARLLKPRGRFYMIHRPFRLGEILSKMVQWGLEPKRMRLVHPYVDKEPNMVLLEGLSGGNSGMKVEKPLIIYEEPGVYTQEAMEIYYGGA